MKTIEATAGIPPEVMADLEHATQLAVAGLRDSQFAQRIATEAARIREAVQRKHGILDIGVPAVRELRDS